jgi:hypothetical protein
MKPTLLQFIKQQLHSKANITVADIQLVPLISYCHCITLTHFSHTRTVAITSKYFINVKRTSGLLSPIALRVPPMLLLVILQYKANNKNKLLEIHCKKCLISFSRVKEKKSP